MLAQSNPNSYHTEAFFKVEVCCNVSYYFFLIGEVRSIIVAFDDPDTGMEQIQRYKHDKEIRAYEKFNGVPIFRTNQIFDVPYRKNYKTHNAKCQIKQFPLKLAWASTGHKVQGITIKKGINVVIHGHKKIPNGMPFFLMIYENMVV